MLLNQKTQFQWQLIYCTNQSPTEVIKTSVLYLILHSQYPNIHANDQLKVDLTQFERYDVCGTCTMANNKQLIAYLKQQCLHFFNNSIELNPEWSKFISQFNDTSAVHFISFAQICPLSTRNRIIIHAFITKRSTTEYRKEIETMKFQVQMLDSIKRKSGWISSECN